MIDQTIADNLKKRAQEGDTSVLRSSEIRSLFDQIKTIAPEERAAYGQAVNKFRDELRDILAEHEAKTEVLPPIDITAPFDINQKDRPKLLPTKHGSQHPLMKELATILDIFYRMGFTAVESREIDDESDIIVINMRAPLDILFHYERNHGLRDPITEDTFEWGLETTVDQDIINDSLIAVERPDLVIVERAEMKSLPDPAVIADATVNFIGGFRMFSGYTDKGNVIPLNYTEALKLRAAPKAEDIGEVFDYKVRGLYPTNAEQTHVPKPAFLRASALFPVLTATLVSEISNRPPIREVPPSLAVRLFAEYHLMARLVDIHDLGVIQNSEVDPLYLGR